MINFPQIFKAFLTFAVLVFLCVAVYHCANQDKEAIIIPPKDSTYHAKADSLNNLRSRIPFYYTDSARAEVLNNYAKYR